MSYLRLTASALLALSLVAPAAAQSQSGQPQSENSGAAENRASQAGSERLPLTAALRRTSVDALQGSLYELIALKHAAQQAHWNVVGVEFYQLHEFYGELYSGLAAPVDRVAERIRALGVAADGRPGAVANHVGGASMSRDKLDVVASLQALTQRYAAVSSKLAERIQATGDDLVTQDLLIGIAHDIDKRLWMLRAHLARVSPRG